MKKKRECFLISFMKTKSFFLFSLSACSLIWADDAPKPPTKKEVVSAIPHVWFSEGLICLKARENSLSFANQSQSVQSANFTTTSPIQPKFEWDNGIRIEAGFQPKEQFYFANWSYIQNTAHGTKSTNGDDGFFPILSMSDTLTSSSFVTSANTDWKLNTQFADFGTIFPWKPSDFFLLKSHAGLRVASLNQKLKAYYGGGIFSEGTDTLKMRNNFLGIGPRIGIIPNILLPAGFSFYGEFAAFGLLARCYTKQEEKYLTNTLFDKTHVMTRFRSGLDAKAALAWQKELLYKAIIISGQIGWEWHEFFKQNFLEQNAFHLSNDNENLFFQGAFVSLCLAF